MSENSTIVLKIGGSLLQRSDRLETFWEGLQELKERASLVLVHGGGAQATAMARRLDHEPRIVQGRRVTSDLDLDIVLWTMCGQLNTELVARASRYDLSPIGLSGADADILRVTKRPPWEIGGETVDFGWVGDVDSVQTDLIEYLLTGDYFPVVAPLGIDTEGRLYNVNADTVACAIAQALNATEFLLVTESGGVQRDIDDPDSRLSRCTRETFETGQSEGWIDGGMQVKLHTAFEALDHGVTRVHVLAPEDVAARKRGTEVIS